MQTLDVISINVWHIIISLCNLLILFLVVKRFLFQPVNTALQKRRASIDKQYVDADEARKAAWADKAAYQQKLEQAQKEADLLLQEAQKTARARSDAMLSDVRDKTDEMYRRARAGIEAEKRRVEREIRQEAVFLSLELTEKMLQREVKADDHRQLIVSFLNEMGGNDDSDQ